MNLAAAKAASRFSWRRYLCACVVSANFRGVPSRVLSTSGFVSTLSQSKAGVPVDVRNRRTCR